MWVEDIKRDSGSLILNENKDGVPANVKTIEYDPNRTAFIALLYYTDGEKRYILAPKGLKVGQQLLSGPGTVPELGNAMALKRNSSGNIYT